MKQLNIENATSVKKSYFNILALFLAQENIESRYLRCLLKWGFQLHLNPEDLKQADVDISHLKFDDKVEKLEAIYNLVSMIYLDDVVEDVELEVATIYAEKLGLKPSVVGELFKSIATEIYDDAKLASVRQEIMDFLKLNNA
jgi:lipopolysaccharide biosynthesis glycosyltransferase